MTDFGTFVQERFGGKLYSGSHDPNGKACLMEAINVYQSKKWSDDTSGTLDLRGLNDARWSSDDVRTAALIPIAPIILGWPKWSETKRQTFAKYMAEQTIKRLLPPVLRRVAALVPEKAPDLVAAALRCETEGSESAAESARTTAWSAWTAESARMAWAWTAWSARTAWSAWSAAESARTAESARMAWSAWSARMAWSAWSAWSARTAAEWAWSAADVPLQEFCLILLEAEARA